MKSILPDIAAASMRLGRDLFNMVLPVTCPVCETPVTGKGGLCARCWGGLELIADPVCDVYGSPMTFDAGDAAVSARAIRNPPGWDRARAAVIFGDVSQKLVHSLKYRDRHEVADTMARLMVHAGRRLFNDVDLVAPVPLHRWRLWSRRYNQSALLAGHVSRQAGLRFEPDLVRRVRNTRSQVGLDVTGRTRNVKRAFTVPPQRVPDILDAHVLLVDDVVTSGATASECARALKVAGAARVDVLAFALVSHED